jgi:GPI biosynthesis protein family Pig-F
VAVASGESLLGALCVSIVAGAFVWLGGVFVRPDDAGVADVGMVAGVVVWDELVRVCGLSPRQWRIEGLSLTTAGAMCGALLGGLITLLDWDTSWQQWPLPGVWGTLLGSSLARLIQRPLTHLAPLAPPELT